MSKRILHIITSPRGEASVSKQLGDVIIGKIQAKYPGSVVKERDLAKEAFPHLDGLQIGSWFTPAASHTPEQIEAIKIQMKRLRKCRRQTYMSLALPSTISQ